MAVYQKRSIEENSAYRIYYGRGTFCTDEQRALFHYDSDVTVTYFKQCSATLKVEGKHYTVHSGDVVIMNPNEIHCCTVEENSAHERISLYINKSILKDFPFPSDTLFDPFYERTGGEHNLIPSQTAQKHHISALIETVLASSAQKNRLLAVCKIIELLFALNDAARDPSQLSVENPIIRDVIDYISSNFTENITSAQIADHFFISKYRLEHLFKACVGVSLWEYVILRRLVYCNDLIQNGISAQEASFAAGFRNYSNFYRLYKKHMGVSPSEYKQRCEK